MNRLFRTLTGRGPRHDRKDDQYREKQPYSYGNDSNPNIVSPQPQQGWGSNGASWNQGGWGSPFPPVGSAFVPPRSPRTPPPVSTCLHDHSQCMTDSHFAECAEMWSRFANTWVPYDKKAIPVKPERADEWNYFCITSRYNDAWSEPHRVLTHFAEPLKGFVLPLCASYGMWGDGSVRPEELEMGQAFRALRKMKERLQVIRDALKPGSNMDAKETFELVKTFGYYQFDESSSPAELRKCLVDLEKQLTVFVNFLEKEFKPTAEKLEKAIRYGYMEFDLLPYYFEPGQEVSVHREGADYAMKLTSINVSENLGIPGTKGVNSISVSGSGYLWDGSGFLHNYLYEMIFRFPGSKEISELAIRLLTPEKREQLTARGRKYKELAGIRYRVCKGEKIVIDRKGYLDYQAESRRQKRRHRRNSYDEEYDQPAPGGPPFPPSPPPAIMNGPSLDYPPYPGTDIQDKLLCLLPNEVFGHNLTTKSWESFPLEKIKPVEFDNKAWEHLVLDAEVKTLIKGLVEVTTKSLANSGAIVNDVIARKGGGLTSVLYGPPGTGKTLTAEAVSELLRRPLFTVGSSDLPREPSKMEEKLKYVLNLATSWDAVLLIDEADVFLEQRSLHEIERNALVSVALRALEYHKGVVFLTTNRIKVFDEAFLSRFSIAIKYPELNKAGRYLIWSRFLEYAGYRIVPSPFITNDDLHEKMIPRQSIEDLAAKPFNGRTIKNLVRTAQALALSSNSPLSMEHINIVVRAQEKFLEDFENERNA